MTKKQTKSIGQRVVVAMSGGVDSSVAAALLKKQGYDVVGVFMRFWGETESGKETVRNSCCSAGAEEAARAVAAKLKIPFYVFSYQKEFKLAVVDHFLAEMSRGRTPNPCVVCNKKIKFGMLFQKALGMGVDFVATGHYARIKKTKNLYKLQKGKDEDKDQSYFLYNLTEQKLANILFPVGAYKKTQVYEMAKKMRLPFRKDESFDLCFVGNSTDNFLGRHLEMTKGKITDLSGRPLGEHPGLAYYTIGQRKSLPLPLGPWWVVAKDNKRNILFVSNKEEDLYSLQVAASDINWISARGPRFPLKVWAKIRYKSEAAEAVLNPKSKIRNPKQIEVKFKKPQRALTPGQSVVFYNRSGEVLGGGVIM
jgi:tRNA-specific 2-thiouridylase